MTREDELRLMRADADETETTERTASLLGTLAATVNEPVTVHDWGCATSPGRRRANEDAWGQAGQVYVIADGMGGRGGGSLAARTAVERLLVHGRRPARRRDWGDVVRGVNGDVRAAGRAGGVERLGTTLLAAVVEASLLTLVHVGDSRAYRCRRRDGRVHLDRLTSDHDVVTELLGAGLDVGAGPRRAVALRGLTSFLGQDVELLRVDVLAVPVVAGDVLVLCTDGVHRQLDDDALRGAMDAVGAREAAAALVRRADEAGGHDNATAMVVRFGADGAGRWATP